MELMININPHHISSRKVIYLQPTNLALEGSVNIKTEVEFDLMFNLENMLNVGRYV